MERPPPGGVQVGSQMERVHNASVARMQDQSPAWVRGSSAALTQGRRTPHLRAGLHCGVSPGRAGAALRLSGRRSPLPPRRGVKAARLGGTAGMRRGLAQQSRATESRRALRQNFYEARRGCFGLGAHRHRERRGR